MRSVEMLQTLIEDAEDRRDAAQREIDDLRDELTSLHFTWRDKSLNGEELLEYRRGYLNRITETLRLMDDVKNMEFPTSATDFRVNQDNIRILAAAVSFDEDGKRFLDRWTAEMERLSQRPNGIGDSAIDRISADDVRRILARANKVWLRNVQELDALMRDVSSAAPSM